MKTIAFLVLSFISVSVNSQVLYFREVPDINSKIMKGINKMRDSLGLKPLKESAEMDSAAKHHAYYTLYDLMFREYPNHDEINDIPNFTEKKKIGERGAKGEIMAYPSIGVKEKILSIKTYEEVVEDAIFRWGKHFQVYDLSLKIVNMYRESKSHYEIIKDKIGEGYYGSFTLFAIVRSPFDNTPMFYTINVIDFK